MFVIFYMELLSVSYVVNQSMSNSSLNLLCVNSKGIRIVVNKLNPFVIVNSDRQSCLLLCS